jgi:hypothetical protein
MRFHSLWHWSVVFRGLLHWERYLTYRHKIQWNLYSSFSSGVWKRNNGSGKTIDARAIVKIGFAQGP